MNRIKQLRSAMVALLTVACWAPCCTAAMVVFSNRAPRDVGFVLVDREEERTLKLAPGEVAALRTGPATEFWFDDDLNNGYRLRAGCAYVFMPGRRLGRSELHRIQLAAEKTWLDDERNTGPASSGAAQPSGSSSSAEGYREARIAVRLACDAAESSTAQAWESRLRSCLADASRITNRQCGVTLEVVEFHVWPSNRPIADFDEALGDLRAAIPAQPAEVVIGFTTRLDHVEPCRSPSTAPLASHLLICEGPRPRPEHERLASLLHALGHYLGAGHSPEPDSIMHSAFGQTGTPSRSLLRFDPINALAMALIADDLSGTKPHGLPDLSPRVRARLESIYATLSEALPSDTTAERWLKLLTSSAMEPPSATRSTIEDARREELLPSTTEMQNPAAPEHTDSPDEVASTHIQRAPDLARDQQPAESDASDQLDELEFYPQQAAPVGGGALDENRPELPGALALAFVLIAVPAGIVVWRLLDRGTAATGHRALGADELTTSNWHPFETIDLAAWSAYLMSVAIVAGLVTASMLSSEHAGFKAAALLLLMGMAATAVAPLYPMAVPLAYLVLAYSLQRDDPATIRIEDSGAMAYLPILALAALFVRSLRQRRCPRAPRDAAVWLLLGMMAWIGLSVLNAVIDGSRVTPDIVHRAARFAQVLALFLATLYAGAGLAELRLTSLLLALALVARVFVFHGAIQLEQNLAMVAAIVCPLLWVTAQTAPSRLTMLGAYLLLAPFVCLIAVIQNRAAMVALPISAAVLLLSSRHLKRTLLMAAPVAVTLAACLTSAGMLDRFGNVYREGEFRGSAYYRLRLWSAGWQMALDHAAFGVGPGNFERYVRSYDPELQAIGPHNGIVQMGGETGLVGMALYLGLILAASLRLAVIIRRYRDDWRGGLAAGVLASLAAHVVTGFFLENPSLAVTYVVLAQGLTLSAVPVTHVYRERIHLPLPNFLAKPLAEISVLSPRIVSGMPIAGRTLFRLHPVKSDVAGASPNEQRPDARGWPGALLAAYIVVSVAGSLAPFAFRAMNLREAAAVYLRQMSQAVELSDRSDWLANVLLFVPLGFLAMAACGGVRREAARRLAVGVLVIVACALFSSFIELVQVWFPARSVNPNDVVAETLGAAAGVLGFLVLGDRLALLTAAMWSTRRPLSNSEKLLVCYAAGLIVYAAWPFDFTINPTDFATKLREGRIALIDWTEPGYFATLAVSAALMAPIGFLLRTLAMPYGESTRSWPALIVWGSAWLLAVEGCRLLAFSQSVGILHLAGGAMGIIVGGLASSSGFFARRRDCL